VLSKAKLIPKEIADYLCVDKTIPHGLRWKNPRSRSVKAGDPAGSLKAHGAYMVQFGKDFYLNHRVIFFLETGINPGCMEVDHVQHDDNCGPLRLVTHQQNQFNRRARKGSSSKYKGVTLVKNKWKASITKDGKRIELGCFDTEEAAAAAYNEVATGLFGEYAHLNQTKKPEMASCTNSNPLKEGGLDA
jgi:hypothetical protein